MAGSRRRSQGLTPEILLRAYSIGLFPMAESADDPEVFWVEPALRGVLPLDDFHVSKSLAKTVRKAPFDIRFDYAFDAVIAACGEATTGRPSTWINTTIRSLYSALHRVGHTHSVEAWDGSELVGGLYGVSLGSAFFGESMFSKVSNASKFAFIKYVQQLKKEHVRLIDCQVYTSHLESLGAEMISRKRFVALIAENI